MALCKEQLGSTKALKSVEFWAELPVLASCLKDVRAKYWGDQWRGLSRVAPIRPATGPAECKGPGYRRSIDVVERKRRKEPGNERHH